MRHSLSFYAVWRSVRNAAWLACIALLLLPAPALGTLSASFTGKPWDASAGLYCFPYRMYSPDRARWMTRDPLGMVDGPNVYGYVSGRPVYLSDPLGLSETWDSCYSEYMDKIYDELIVLSRNTGTGQLWGYVADFATVAACGVALYFAPPSLGATAPAVVIICGSIGFLGAGSTALDFYRTRGKRGSMFRTFQDAGDELDDCINRADTPDFPEDYTGHEDYFRDARGHVRRFRPELPDS